MDDRAKVDCVANARALAPVIAAAVPRIEADRELPADLVDALHERVLSDRVPFLGICIGLQILFEHSEEGDVDGLGWIPGVVRRFPDSVRVPQIGWNTVEPTRAHPVTDGLVAPADETCSTISAPATARATPARLMPELCESRASPARFRCSPALPNQRSRLPSDPALRAPRDCAAREAVPKSGGSAAAPTRCALAACCAWRSD